MKKLNTEIFITRAQKVQGNKYDYSEVSYINNHSKVIIICKLHGQFLQRPHDHLQGQGCPTCGNNAQACKKSKTLDTFITDAQKIHGNLYDYSKVNYINDCTKVNILCKLHGPFLQIPGDHLHKNGCPTCAGCQRKTTEMFIFEAHAMHGGLYGYTMVEYKSAHKKVIIDCELHGPFLQSPSKHLHGQGCPICSNNLTKTTNIFVMGAQNVHGNIYDYSKVKYINDRTKVSIICKLHGGFTQKPNKHLSGQGCPICNCSKGEKQVAQVLDSLNIKYQREFSFPDLLGDFLPLRFDFAVVRPKKLICLIEYDGPQHFKHLKNFILLEKFKTLQKYDKLKNKYCKQHNIKLIRISYKCKDIEKYLKEHLN